jgi:hypothetical protein
MSKHNIILKSFGFEVEEDEKKSTIPENIFIEVGEKKYSLNSIAAMKISELINNKLKCNNDLNITDDIMQMPAPINEKFMDFLDDYVKYVERKGIPTFVRDNIIKATVLEAAIGDELHALFVKNFNYKFQRSDIAVKEYLNTFCRMLECSSAIISDSLKSIFCIAIKIIIQHLPSAEFIPAEH